MRIRIVVSLAASLGIAVPAIVSAQVAGAPAGDPPTLLGLVYQPRPVVVAHPPIQRGLVYQPRGSAPPPYHHPAPPPAFSQGYFELHGGAFRIQETAVDATDLGGKLALSLAPSLRIGTLFDWQYRSISETVPISSSPGPGGTTITNEVDLGSGRSDLFPWLGFIELGPIPRAVVSPYAGVGAGYEWLDLHATRSDIPVAFDATYGGFGWQAWGGVAVHVSDSIKLNAEAYGNFAKVSRDAYDVAMDAMVRESVKVDGVGIRGGLQFGF